MGLLDGIGSVLDSGAVQSAVKVGTQPSLWDGVSNFATNAFSWIGENPEAANLIGGVATGIGQAYLQNKRDEKQQEFEREMFDREREARYVQPGEIGDYGSHLSLTNGLISNGMITNRG